MWFQVVTINGKIIAFEAEEVISYDDTYQFLYDGEVVGEFNKKNIAGYFSTELEDEEDDE